jgi:hypothetical protein
MARPTISKADLVRLEKICDRALGEEKSALHKFNVWRARVTRKMGGSNQWDEWFVTFSVQDLPFPLRLKFFKTLSLTESKETRKKMAQKSREMINAQLSAAGLELAKDYSFDGSGGVLLNEAAGQVLKDSSPGVWSQLVDLGEIVTENHCPWEAVEKRLGVPFRENLAARFLELVKQGRSPRVLSSWLAEVNCAVCFQVLGDSGNLYLFNLLMSRLVHKYSKSLVDIWATLRPRKVASSEELLDMGINCLEDVARAAGASEENGEILGEGMTRAALMRLALVWRGSDAPISEVIAELDKVKGQSL